MQKEEAYMLGYLWADGGFSRWAFNLHILKDDGDAIFSTLNKVFEWKKYYYNRCPNQYIIQRCDGKYRKKILDLGYVPHRNCPLKAIHAVPKDLQYYWFRGYFDGDGCFYFNAKNYIRHFILASHNKQDWTFMYNLCNELDIKGCKDEIRYNKKGSGSALRIANKPDIKKLGDYIYQQYDGIGLTRKYDKYLQIIS